TYQKRQLSDAAQSQKWAAQYAKAATARTWAGSGSGRDGSRLAAPRSEPGVQISCTGLPRTDRSAFDQGLDPRVCHSRLWKLEPRLSVQALEVAASFGSLAAARQRPLPESTDSPPHAVQLWGAEAESEVLEVAVECLCQVSLLLPHALMPV